MSEPTEPWLIQHVEALRAGSLDGRDRIEALSDLVVNDAVPADIAQQVLVAVGDGWLSPAGDVLGWDDTEGQSARVYIEGTSLLGEPQVEE